MNLVGLLPSHLLGGAFALGTGIPLWLGPLTLATLTLVFRCSILLGGSYLPGTLALSKGYCVARKQVLILLR